MSHTLTNFGEDTFGGLVLLTLILVVVLVVLYVRSDPNKLGDERWRIVRACGSAKSLAAALETAPDGLCDTVPGGQTIVHAAIQANAAHLLETLAASGAPMLAADEKGRTPLHIASTASMIAALSRACPALVQTHGTAVANEALGTGNNTLAKALLDAGAVFDEASMTRAIPSVACSAYRILPLVASTQKMVRGAQVPHLPPLPLLSPLPTVTLVSKYFKANSSHINVAISCSSARAVTWLLDSGVVCTYEHLRASVASHKEDIATVLVARLPSPTEAARTAVFAALQLVPTSGTSMLQWALPVAARASGTGAFFPAAVEEWVAYVEDKQSEARDEKRRALVSVGSAERTLADCRQQLRATQAAEAPLLLLAKTQIALADVADDEARELDERARALRARARANEQQQQQLMEQPGGVPGGSTPPPRIPAAHVQADEQPGVLLARADALSSDASSKRRGVDVSRRLAQQAEATSRGRIAERERASEAAAAALERAQRALSTCRAELHNFDDALRLLLARRRAGKAEPAAAHKVAAAAAAAAAEEEDEDDDPEAPDSKGLRRKQAASSPSSSVTTKTVTTKTITTQVIVGGGVTQVAKGRQRAQSRGRA
jgi:hypothetical protein